jgi:hypothetical protein
MDGMWQSAEPAPLVFYSENGDSRFLWNVDTYVPKPVVSHPLKTVSIIHSHGKNLDFAKVKDFHCFVFRMSPKPLLSYFRTRKQKRMSDNTRYSVGILIFQSLAVTLHTTRFKIKKFYAVPTLRLCVLYGSQNKQQLLPYKTLRDWFL